MGGRASRWTLRRMKLPLSRFAYPDSSPRLSPAMLCPISLGYRPRAEGHPDSWRRALTCTHAESDHEGEFCKIGSTKKKSTEQQQRHGRGRGRGGGCFDERHGSGADVRSARWAELFHRQACRIPYNLISKPLYALCQRPREQRKHGDLDARPETRPGCGYSVPRVGREAYLQRYQQHRVVGTSHYAVALGGCAGGMRWGRGASN